MDVPCESDLFVVHLDRPKTALPVTCRDSYSFTKGLAGWLCYDALVLPHASACPCYHVSMIHGAVRPLVLAVYLCIVWTGECSENVNL